MKKIKMLVPALVLFAALNVTYRVVNRTESSLALLMSAVEKAEASSEYSGTESFSKLKRYTCVLPGNAYTSNTGVHGNIGFNGEWNFGANGDGYVTVQGSQGYYTDCKFTLFRKCNRSEIDFTCRQ